MPSRKWSAKDFTTLPADPDSQPMRCRSFAAPCDHALLGDASAAPPTATRNARLRMWTVIEPSLDVVAKRCDLCRVPLAELNHQDNIYMSVPKINYQPA